MKRRLIEFTGLLLVLGFFGLLVVASGIVPIKASSGHWGITRAFLTLAMRRSVETHTIGVRVPELDDPSLVLRGAGHYDRACQVCHGAPGERAATITAQLTPEPPYLPDVVPLWDPAELFYIVKHGIKMTGMPAWPALEREDEVWAMVAFLVRLPGMSPEEYQRLTWGEVPDTSEELGLERLGAPPSRVVETCRQCHGPRGLGRGTGAFPRIAGQSPAYLAGALAAYAAGERPSAIMESVAAALDEETMLELARHYGEEVVTLSGALAEPALLEQGVRIAEEGIPRRKVPACTDCHGPTDRPRNPNYPALGGQYADYLALQLRLFREEKRGGSKYAHIMREVVHRLEPEEAAAVAAWYASLPWESVDRR